MQETWIGLQAVVDGRLQEGAEPDKHPWPPCGDAALDEAQAIMRAVASKSMSRKQLADRVAAARRALSLSPKCCDAYIELVCLCVCVSASVCLCVCMCVYGPLGGELIAVRLKLFPPSTCEPPSS